LIARPLFKVPFSPARGNLLAVKAKDGARAGLKGTLNSGRAINGLR